MSSTVKNMIETKGDIVWSIGPNETVFEALRMMAAKQVGALLVMEGDKLIGIISERDYARKVILMGKTSRDTLVSEIMTEDVITVHPSQTVHECMELMTNEHVRHLPVTLNDKVVGIVSIGDVVRLIMYEQREKIKKLENTLLNQ